MGRRLVALLALALIAAPAFAAEHSQGQQVKSSDVTGASQSGPSAASSGTWNVRLVGTNGGAASTETNPLNSRVLAGIMLVNEDTLSYNGRSLDSTLTVSDISAVRVLSLGLKITGAQGAAGGFVRIGVTCVMSHSPVASDTTMSFAIAPMNVSPTATDTTAFGTTLNATASTSNVGVSFGNNERTVAFLAASAVAVNYATIRTANLVYYNPGYKYVRWYFRLLSEPQAIDAGNGTRQVLKLSAVLGGRAL